MYMQNKKISFYMFYTLLTVFFIVPAPYQHWLRVLLGVIFFALYVFVPMPKRLRNHSALMLATLCTLGVVMFARGTLVTSYVNMLLCCTGLVCIFHFTAGCYANTKALARLHLVCGVALVLQAAAYSYEGVEGRLTLGYELNHSGAYLFLFFLLSDALRKRWWKLLVIAASLLLLSRALVFALALFYLIRYSKKCFRRALQRFLNPAALVCGAYILFGCFSFWYVQNMVPEEMYDNTKSRLTKVNDGSNYLRFSANRTLLEDIAEAPLSANVLLGRGDVAFKGPTMMPHNEFFNNVLEVGVIASLILAFFSLSVINKLKLVSFCNVEYFLPLLFYTLILWVRFLVTPSFEMIFIVLLLRFTQQKNTLYAQ
jgi:hypothetical protein